MASRLERVLSIPEVAAIAGWNRRRMLRHLLRLNVEVGGMLLRNAGTLHCPRYTVTMTALKQCAPEWFREPEKFEAHVEQTQGQLDQLRSEVRQLKRIVDMLSDRLVAFAKRDVCLNVPFA